MDFYAHLAGGVGALVLLLLAGWNFSPALFAAVTLGAILPDADHSKSKLFGLVSGVVAGLAGAVVFFLFFNNGIENALVAAAVGGGFAVVLLALLKPRHRGIVHSFAAAAAYGIAVAALARGSGTPDWLGLGAGAAAGFASHLLLDWEWKIF